MFGFWVTKQPKVFVSKNSSLVSSLQKAMHSIGGKDRHKVSVVSVFQLFHPIGHFFHQCGGTSIDRKSPQVYTNLSRFCLHDDPKRCAGFVLSVQDPEIRNAQDGLQETQTGAYLSDGRTDHTDREWVHTRVRDGTECRYLWNSTDAIHRG